MNLSDFACNSPSRPGQAVFSKVLKGPKDLKDLKDLPPCRCRATLLFTTARGFPPKRNGARPVPGRAPRSEGVAVAQPFFFWNSAMKSTSASTASTGHAL